MAEIKAYIIAVWNWNPCDEETGKYIATFEGLFDAHVKFPHNKPAYLLLFFCSADQAKRAANRMEEKGFKCTKFL